MSDKIDDGGAAFPAPVIIIPGSGLPTDESEAVSQELPTSGLFVRDYFAANATDADVSAAMGDIEWRSESDSATRSRARYAFADAMILARKQK